jgi:exo-beta-1,3-glucanase (GH17 family)
VFDRYDLLRQTFPGKRIVVGEVGWPSDGVARGQAVPSLTNQTSFLREFLQGAHDRGPEYFVLEAFDQPWKTGEGDVGPLCGGGGGGLLNRQQPGCPATTDPAGQPDERRPRATA